MTSEETFADQDILTDLLLDAKYLSTQCHTAVIEAANNNVREEFERMMNEHLNHQRQIYETMEERGWYTPLRPGVHLQEVAEEITPQTRDGVWTRRREG